MQKHSPRSPVPGPAFIRQLARFSDAQLPASSPPLADRLGQWIDWNRAVAVSRALDGTLPTATTADTPDVAALQAQCRHARATLEATIASDLAQETGKPKNTRQTDTAMATMAVIDYAPFQQRYLSLQRAILSASGRLRGLLRDALAQVSADMARLAEVDAVMEQTLSPREQTLLATIPTVLEQHFQRLRAAGLQHDADAPTHTLPATPDDAWLERFRQDLHSLLRAELDVRFHPIEALLAALRSR
ncbi:DUF3348 domain-containing protein [Xanthomonas sp. MUS 060]|uniref:DUF3348 domain-containing protein n=1 Tax=Xanthomonas sp. MUS 060 TaxID=1588031 RepID=UPI0005F2D711|nr:DUF3348 domain-containing protein [Xanthomonas sp. MUS 060]